MYNFLLKYTPNFIHNLFITVYNIKQYQKRYGKFYPVFKKEIKDDFSYAQLRTYQLEELKNLVAFAFKNSPFYNKLLKEEVVASFKDISDLEKFPIVNKEQLRQNIDNVYTIKKNKAIVSKTGGTTGKTLEVYYTKKDMQKRFAFLDAFREKYNYKLGERTAWFSGKNILNQQNIRRNIFWKYDFYHKVKYYSTFHCSGKNLKYILEDLQKFNPRYLSGFPFALFEIATYGLNNNINYNGTIEAIFPTAETITQEMKYVIETFFKANAYNQYASSEGAPFIFECKNKHLHLELRSGVFEVLNDKNEATKGTGRLVVTSFSTYGTPLIRYDIGDEITLYKDNTTCNCGNNNPIIKNINGRKIDFIYSPFTGKISSANIANAAKGVKGIIKFQIVQDQEESIDVFIEKEESIYNIKYEKVFLNNLYDRFGKQMNINLKYVKQINKEKSGKFRFIKNNITDKIAQ